MIEGTPQLKVELNRWGLTGFSGRTVVEDRQLTFSRSWSGMILVERELKPDEIEKVQGFISQLTQINLRNSYDRSWDGNGPHTVLDISRIEPKFKKRIYVQSNPYNPAPPEVLSLVRYLLMLV